MGDTTLAALDLLRTRSLASLAAQEIERMILDGELKAGERLNEQALAARLKVSRGPVREAIRGLERAGLVVTVINQGSYVRQVSAEEALELYEVRVAITGHACAKLARSIAPEQLAALRELVRRMEAAHAAGDAAGYYELNIDFHAALLGFLGNARLLRINDELGHELNLFRRRSLVTAAGMAASNAEHAEIVDAIAAGDAARARTAGEAHILHGMRRFSATTPGMEPRQIDAGAGPPEERTADG